MGDSVSASGERAVVVAAGPAPSPVAVLVSGAGTNLAALLEASGDPAYGVRVALVIADQASAAGLDKARAADVPTAVLPLGRRPTSRAGETERESWRRELESWDAAMTQSLRTVSPHLVVSAGFMRLLGPQVLGAFAYRVVNTHPALLPAFPGTHAVRDALAYGVRVTGATVHLVDGGVDTGPVIGQRAVEVRPGDDESTLHERIKELERPMLVDVVGRMARNGYEVHGRRVVLR